MSKIIERLSDSTIRCPRGPYCETTYSANSPRSILTEHFAGRWPFWISPRQVMVIPVMPAVNDYVKEVQSRLRAEGLHADIDISGNTMQKKIRTAQLALYNFIIVVGAEERENKAANVRNRDDQESQKRGEVIPLDDVVKKLVELRNERRLDNKI